MGWPHVPGSVNHPANIHAAACWAGPIVREFIASPAFQHDPGEAKAKLASAAAQP
jgi:hypothetical protein